MSQLLHNLCPTTKLILKFCRSVEGKLGLETFVRFFFLLLVDLSLNLSMDCQVPAISKDSMTGTQAGETRNVPQMGVVLCRSKEHCFNKVGA